MNLNKGISTPIALTIIIVLTLLVIGGALGYQYYWMSKEENKASVMQSSEPKKSEDETVNWKTYMDTQYGFEIKYPEDWRVAEHIYILEPNLVFCPFSLTGPDSEVVCKLKEGTVEPRFRYEEGMIYLFGFGGDLKDLKSSIDSPKFHYLGSSVSGRHYYLYSESNESIINQMFFTFRFVKVSEEKIDETIPHWITPWWIPGGININDCIMYGLLDSLSECYNKHCVKINSVLEKSSLIGKTIISAAASGIEWKFINNTNVLIARGHAVDDIAVPNQIGTWEIKNGEIITQDPFIKEPNGQYSFKNLQFFDCGNGKIEGVAMRIWWMDDGSGYKEHLIENRIQTR